MRRCAPVAVVIKIMPHFVCKSRGPIDYGVVFPVALVAAAVAVVVVVAVTLTHELTHKSNANIEFEWPRLISVCSVGAICSQQVASSCLRNPQLADNRVAENHYSQCEIYHDLVTE